MTEATVFTAAPDNVEHGLSRRRGAFTAGRRGVAGIAPDSGRAFLSLCHDGFPALEQARLRRRMTDVVTR